MGLLSGKVAIVTGAAVGLGRAIAVAYAREGARVVVNYSKSSDEAKQTAELAREAGGETWVVQADVSQDRQVKAMVAGTLDRFGRIDVLVNNAGIIKTLPFSDLDALTEELWDAQLNVHVKGTFMCSRAVAGPMRRQGRGRIINIASIAGVWSKGSSIAYSTSKAAVIHLTKCLARVLGPEIRVNVIAPGFVPDTRGNAGRAAEPMIQEAALKRAGQPSDVAELALFLATKAEFMSGAVIVLDGGRVC